MITNRRRVQIQWGDCDPAQIVYFPRYFAIFDDCTSALFEAAGFRKREMIRQFDIVGIPVVDVHAKFYMPSVYGDDVDIETTIGKWGRSSFEVLHRLLKDGELAIEGFETRVWVGRHPEKPDGIQARPIPKEVMERFHRV